MDLTLPVLDLNQNTAHISVFLSANVIVIQRMIRIILFVHHWFLWKPNGTQ